MPGTMAWHLCASSWRAEHGLAVSAPLLQLYAHTEQAPATTTNNCGNLAFILAPSFSSASSSAACFCCCRRSGTYFCVDKSVTAVVIQGLAEHKDQLGAPLCPCRHYDDKEAEVAQGFWNCPCVPMRERKVRQQQQRNSGSSGSSSGSCSR